MKTDELRAAADRLARIAAGKEKSQDIYGVTVDESRGRAGVIEAGNKIKRAMLDDERALREYGVASLPPADDAEPVTEEWLREVGFVRAWGFAFRRQGGAIAVVYDPADGLSLSHRTDEWPVRPPPITRGDVRRLLAAVRVTP